MGSRGYIIKVGESEKQKSYKSGIDERNKFRDSKDQTCTLAEGWEFLGKGMTTRANAQIVI